MNKQEQNKWSNISIKWRPQKFCHVLGQKIVSTILKNSAKTKKLSTAYLLCGTRGCGKTSLARLFAKSLNCTNLSDGEPCAQCQSCIEIHKGSSLSVIEIDAASNRGIDDIRSLTETCKYASAHGVYKVYIIDEVHMLTKEAFNALLKTLEEPPKNVVFVLATTDPQKIPATVLSRCMKLSMNNISEDEIVKKLENISSSLNASFGSETIGKIAYKADGSLRDAESMLQQLACFSENDLNQEIIDNILGLANIETLLLLDEAIINSDISKSKSISDTFLSKTSDVAELLIQIIDHYKTHAYIMSGSINICLPLMYEKFKERFYEYNKQICTRTVCYIIKKVKETLPVIHINYKIIFECLIMEIIESKKYVSLEIAISECIKKENIHTKAITTKTNTNTEKDSLANQKIENSVYFISGFLGGKVTIKPI